LYFSIYINGVVTAPTSAVPDQVACSDAGTIILEVESIYPFTYNWYGFGGQTVMGNGNEISIPVPDEGTYIFLVEAVSPSAPIYTTDVNQNFACSGDIAEFTVSLLDPEANDQVAILETPNGQLSLTPLGNGQYAGSVTLSNGFCAPDMQTFTITAYCNDGVTAIGQFTEDIIVYPSTIEPFINVSISEDGCTATAMVTPGCETYIIPTNSWTNTIVPGDKTNSEFDYTYFSSTVNSIGCFNSEGTAIFGHVCTEPVDPPDPEPCANVAGLMQTSQTYICDGDAVVMAAAFAETDGNSVRSFVLHEGEVFDPATSTVISSNLNGQFNSPGAAYNNIPLYISAITGYPDENGYPIIDHPCTVWTPYGAYALFFDAIDVTIVDDICTGTQYFVTVSVNGGVGIVAPHAAYLTVSDGNQTFANISADEEVTFGPYEGVGQYEIEVLDVKGCRGGLIGSYSCGTTTQKTISSQSNNALVELYPNPTEGIFDMLCLNCEQLPIAAKVYNASGREILVKTEHELALFKTQFDVSKEATGIYLLKLEFADGSYQHFKVVKE